MYDLSARGGPARNAPMAGDLRFNIVLHPGRLNTRATKENKTKDTKESRHRNLIDQLHLNGKVK